MPETDAELIKRFSLHNDYAAFNQIVERYRNLIWKVALRFTSDTDDTQDIVQETFIRLIETAPRYRPEASLSTFLYRIVTNLCIDYKKKKRPDPHENIDIFTNTEETSHEYTIDSKRRSTHLNSVLRQLPERQRLAIIYKYDHNLSIREIAEIMKSSEKAVERLLAHGRESLKNSIEKKYN